MAPMWLAHFLIWQVGNVDFSYFEESAMAARARLAGLGDDQLGEERGGGGVEGFDEEAEALARELDEELAELLDGDGDVLTF